MYKWDITHRQAISDFQTSHGSVSAHGTRLENSFNFFRCFVAIVDYSTLEFPFDCSPISLLFLGTGNNRLWRCNVNKNDFYGSRIATYKCDTTNLKTKLLVVEN